MGSSPDTRLARAAGSSEKEIEEDPMAGSIICGVADSVSAKRAARVARRLSGELGLRVVFVRAVEPGSPDEKISAIAERLQHLTEGCPDVDCGAGWIVEIGHPVDRLVAAAADEDARFIVVGAQGPRPSLVGSVSAQVSRHASCPVVVVPPGADEPSHDDHGDVDFAGGVARFDARG
jgi:nucleotide-binding universal stress UspA family protein